MNQVYILHSIANQLSKSSSSVLIKCVQIWSRVRAPSSRRRCTCSTTRTRSSSCSSLILSRRPRSAPSVSSRPLPTLQVCTTTTTTGVHTFFELLIKSRFQFPIRRYISYHHSQSSVQVFVHAVVSRNYAQCHQQRADERERNCGSGRDQQWHHQGGERLRVLRGIQRESGLLVSDAQSDARPRASRWQVLEVESTHRAILRLQVEQSCLVVVVVLFLFVLLLLFIVIVYIGDRACACQHARHEQQRKSQQRCQQ